RIRPYLVKRIINPNTKEEIVSDRKELLFSDREKFLRIYGTKVISRETALRIRKILLEVVKRGTGKSAYIPGLEICGKTGTAQKAINGVYTDKSFASFVGMAPCEKPRIIAMIIVDEPQKAFQFGGVASAPYVGRFISRLSAIAPEYIPAGVSSEPKIAKVESVSTPNLVMLYKEQAEKLLRWLELEPVFMGNGNIVLSQMPPEKTSLKKGEKVYLTLGNANNLSLNNNNDKKLVPD
ncbi:MAG: penicillin-binding transpeptidase domain-containing protein, partial [bacterium]